MRAGKNKVDKVTYLKGEQKIETESTGKDETTSAKYWKFLRVKNKGLKRIIISLNIVYMLLFLSMLYGGYLEYINDVESYYEHRGIMGYVLFEPKIYSTRYLVYFVAPLCIYIGVIIVLRFIYWIYDGFKESS